MAQPPLPLQEFLPLQPLSPLLQPPLPLQEFLPLQACFSTSAKPAACPGKAGAVDMLEPLPLTGAALTRFMVPPNRPANAAVRTNELFDILVTESPLTVSEDYEAGEDTASTFPTFDLVACNCPKLPDYGHHFVAGLFVTAVRLDLFRTKKFALRGSDHCGLPGTRRMRMPVPPSS